MFLIKCKCSGIFTITDENLGETKKTCPNCRKTIPLDRYISVYENQGLSELVEYVRYIPDNAKITVTFDA